MKRSILDIIAACLHGAGRPQEVVYRFLLGQFVGASYIWGGSSVCGTDCSGSVCACLSRAIGKQFRVTADELFRNYFSKDAADVASLEGEIAAAFFLDKDGRAVHVAGYQGRGMFVNASSIEPGGRASKRSYEELLGMYRNFRPRLRIYPQADKGRLLAYAGGRKAKRRNHENFAV